MAPNHTQLPGKQRISSIDILRGLVIVIMAIDHCRDFLHFQGPSPTNIATTTPILFFTRWITHYCAPTFVFLSGISAYLAGMRRTRAGLSLFLIKRGLWLIVVEVVVMTFGFTLNPAYNMWVLEVIWAIGCSMVLLGLLVRAPLTVIGIIGGLIFFGHDIFDLIAAPKTGAAGTLIKLFFTAFGSVIPVGGGRIILDGYAIVPWTGVMLIGYVFGSLYEQAVDQQRRRRVLLTTGLLFIGLFLVLRLLNGYGDPAPWAIQRSGVYTVLSFLNTSKYPPSLLYLCMTLGPALIVLALMEKVKNRLTDIFLIYGNVPFFFFVLHFYLIRLINIILFFALGYHTNQITDTASPFNFKPATFGISLGAVYLVWVVVITVMYFPCKWYGNYKKTHTHWWLSYL